MLEAPILEAMDLHRRFGGVTALAGVSLTVAEGSITALIGPNGAGKTTAFATMAGFHRPDRGIVRFAGHDITGWKPERIARLGLVRTFQIVQPFGTLSVRDNIAVGAHLHMARRADAHRLAESVANRVDLARDLGKPANTLPIAGRKRLELARALATNPRMLLLDEVMAGLNPGEVAALLPAIRAIRDSGVTLLMIEHVMHAVAELAEHVIVLAEGRVIAEGSVAAVARDPLVVDAYLGEGAAQRLASHDAA